MQHDEPIAQGQQIQQGADWIEVPVPGVRLSPEDRPRWQMLLRALLLGLLALFIILGFTWSAIGIFL